MDIGVFQGVVTAVLLVLFVGLAIRTWSAKRKSEFQSAAQMPLADDSRPPVGDNETEQKS